MGPGPSSTAAVFVQRDARYVGVIPWEAVGRGQPEVTRVLTRPRSYRDDLQKEFGSAIVLISHDRAVVAEVAVKALVMYRSRCVESGTVHGALAAPRHPWRAPVVDQPADRLRFLPAVRLRQSRPPSANPPTHPTWPDPPNESGSSMTAHALREQSR